MGGILGIAVKYADAIYQTDNAIGRTVRYTGWIDIIIGIPRNNSGGNYDMVSSISLDDENSPLATFRHAITGQVAFPAVLKQ